MRTLFKERWLRLPLIVRRIIILFIVTRVVLISIGLIYHDISDSALKELSLKKPAAIEKTLVLSMWKVWDSEWYLDIASHGYTKIKPLPLDHYLNLAFFPLYPLLIFIVGKIIGSYFFAGLVVSNVAFLIAAYILYKLIRLDYDEATSLRTVTYLFVFPTAFIFSGIFTESLFLCLTVLSLYLARKNLWWLAGLCGYLVALTRPVGILLALPLFIIYLSSIRYNWREIKPNIVSVGLIPLGLLTFSAYTYAISGDFLAYPHLQQAVWGHHFSEPLTIILQNIMDHDYTHRIQGLFTLGAFLVLLFSIKKIRFHYWVFAIALLLSGPATGVLDGAMRYLTVIFPFFLLFAILGKNEETDRVLTVGLSMLQAVLFILWTTGTWFMS